MLHVQNNKMTLFSCKYLLLFCTCNLAAMKNLYKLAHIYKENGSTSELSHIKRHISSDVLAHCALLF